MHLRKVKCEDKEQIYKWRNSPYLIKLGSSGKKVSWDEHSKWFEKTIDDPLVYLYIICNNKLSVGQLRFELFEDTFFKTSIYLDKKFIGKGLGPKALILGCSLVSKEYEQGTFIAHIKDDNQASIKAFQKAGFLKSNIYLIDKHITLSKNYN